MGNLPAYPTHTPLRTYHTSLVLQEFHHVQFAELPYTLLPTYPTLGRKFRFFQVEFAGLPYTATLSGLHYG
jgi:hypothetical protein